MARRRFPGNELNSTAAADLDVLVRGGVRLDFVVGVDGIHNVPCVTVRRGACWPLERLGENDVHALDVRWGNGGDKAGDEGSEDALLEAHFEGLKSEMTGSAEF